MSVRLLALDAPADFDTIAAEDIEAARQSMGLTQPEFAGHLGWSPRKYVRMLDAADETGFVERDTALAVRGLVGLLAGPDPSPVKDLFDRVTPRWESDRARTFAGGGTFPGIIDSFAERSGAWTTEVTPPLFRLVARRAAEGRTITYGEAATTLEDNGLIRRVWPRTLYGMPLGRICEALMALSVETGIRVPLLSAIVVTASGSPGEGVDGMIRLFVRQHQTGADLKISLSRLKRDRDAMIEELQQEVFDFRDWPGVLRALGIEEGKE